MKHDIVIVGGGAAGIGTAASLLKRQKNLDILIIEPAEQHYYQPGWTMVGGGIFNPSQTVREMAKVMPAGVTWKKDAVATFEPEQNAVTLISGDRVSYDMLVVAPGLKLDWEAVSGLKESLGQYGITSNYRYDLAPYTWKLVQELTSGIALFTQPTMPIKCAGAPQKAMYLSCDHWYKNGVINDIKVEYHNAMGALFGVADYVPALMEYIEKYNAELCFFEMLVGVDGSNKTAVFEKTTDSGTERIEKQFDMLHVCPPQTAPDFIRESPLAAADGWVDVDPFTMRHVRFDNIYSLGDVASTANAKTAAAVRKQAPLVAANMLQQMAGQEPDHKYDGYGSCPLTVERGKIVLAEFGYDGKLLPTFPKWFIDGLRPTKMAWALKESILPGVYWNGLLKGNEWLAKPKL